MKSHREEKIQQTESILHILQPFTFGELVLKQRKGNYDNYSSFHLIFFFKLHSWLFLCLQSIERHTPGSRHSGHKNSPCAWRRTPEERVGWDRSRLGRRGCRDCCRGAASERGRPEPLAGTEHSCKLPYLRLDGLHGKRCSVCGMWCNVPCGWCEEDSSVPPVREPKAEIHKGLT